MTDLVPLVAVLDRARVLCIGDVMLDRFVYGEVERISPEAPIPVLQVARETAMLGGAGNVVRNLTSLGASVRFVAAVGDDGAGADIDRLLADQATAKATLVAVAGRRTAIKTRFIAGSQQLLRADRETKAPLSEDARSQVIEAAREALPEVAVVVLSDYGKGVLEAGMAAELIALARAAGKPVIVDPKGSDYERYRGAGLLTPNRKELHEATRMPVDGPDRIAAAAQSLIAAHGVDAVLATLGADGMMLVRADGRRTALSAEAREVFDVSGAGDTVVATLAAALASGADLEQAAALANVAAGIVVGKVGTATCYPDEVTAALHHRDISDAEIKVLSLEQALQRREAWRGQGLKVGFTNGCFDLLHAGHVALLAQARANCDRLIVGLNADDSVRRLNKGPERPINGEMARAVVLASLGSVDAVVLFGEDTPLKLIEILKPDLLVKGSDYTLDTVVGAEIVQSHGGRVLLADLKPGFSTTGIVARLSQ
ncbi:MAG: D-glycero-beta-D-manno-heptose-7-phosphate kinase [Magnetospirillum sp. WYHS-4]